LFDAGTGTISARFTVIDVGPQTIAPIVGCEIDLPLPPSATQVIIMPDLIAFESTAQSDEIVSFYQAALLEAGWESTAEPQTGADAILLSYRRGDENVDINIETRETGVHVELLLNTLE
jgi:hypothetical protein